MSFRVIIKYCLIAFIFAWAPIAVSGDCHPVTPPPPPVTSPVMGGVFDTLATMVSGQVVEIANNLDDAIIPGDSLEYSTKGYCSDTKCTFIGQGHQLDSPNLHIEYDFAANVWSRLPDAPVDIGHGYASIAADGNVIYLKAWNSDAFYKYENAIWSKLPPTGNQYVNGQLGAIEYFPNVGLILYEPYEGVFVFNGLSWSEPFVNSNYFTAVHCDMTMDTQNGVMLFGGCSSPPSNQVLRQFDVNGVVSNRTFPVATWGPRSGAVLDDHLFTISGKVYKRSNDLWLLIGSHNFVTIDGDMFTFFDLGTGYLVLSDDFKTYLYKK